MDRMADTPMCAYCRSLPVESKWRPFCSERCQLLDLERWVDGTYRVPVEQPSEATPDEDDEEL